MRKIIIILLALTTLLFAGYVSLRGYRTWKQDHMLSLARDFMAKSDNRNAILALQQVLASNPGNLDALRLMAELKENARSPEALILRSRVVESAPSSVNDGFALVRTALMFNDLITASNALERLPDSGRSTADYHKFAGLLDTVAGRVTSAENHLLEALRLEPTNKVPRLNLATLRIHQTNLEVQAEGRATLKELSTDAELRCKALRELVGDASRKGETNEVAALLGQLVQQTDATFGDRLLQVEFFRQTQNPSFQPRLQFLENEAAKDPAKTHELVTWQMTQGSPAHALAWMCTLPGDIQTNQPVAFLCADCRSALKDWDGLQSSLEPQNWGELEFMRHALLSRALRERDLTSSAKTEWEQALKAAGGQKEKLAALLRLVIYWKLPGEQEQLLWIFVNQFPSEKWAHELLARLLYGNGRTEELLTLFSQLSRTNPADLETKNNLAMAALLLDASQFKPYSLAREVYEQVPTNSSYASTYALALYKQAKIDEALKILQQLKPKDLEKPSIAACYAVLLQKTGRKEEVKKYADLAAKGPLLPEERKLLQKAGLD